MLSILMLAELPDAAAASTVDTILKNPKFYGY